MTDIDETMFDPCGRCGGPLIVLGALGSRVWARCRDCGGEEAEMVVDGESCDGCGAFFALNCACIDEEAQL